MWFSPGADAIITTVPEKGCLCLLLSSPYSPVTLQCSASLLLLKVIHAGGKLDLWLGVTHCGSSNATGLVATSAQWHWYCCGLVACTRAPEPPWLVQLSPHCHPRLRWHRGWVCLHIQRLLPLPAARCAQETGVTLSCVSLPAVARRALLTWLVPHTGQQESDP